MRNMFLDLLRRTIARPVKALIGSLLACATCLRPTSLNLYNRGLQILAALALLVASLATEPARAVPSFAIQTGQPCAACHIGAFGPQLTPYGRDFKLHGYVASDGKDHGLPLAWATQ